jgi:hypothetical protein
MPRRITMKKAIKRENPVIAETRRKEIQTNQRPKKEWDNKIKTSIIELEKAEREWEEAKAVYWKAKGQLFWAQNSLIAEALSYYFKFNRKTEK